ncbi:MAG: hypothetical protein BMS9Abin12_0144 [Acidimicrobiia bacterium]|nr:MAG: hypothetical protein BMS9Abin12_0144 [Acidimicrobiia bacterium]
MTRKPSLPSWMPNPGNSVRLFAFEAMTVLVLAVISIGLAFVALWLF